MHTGSTEWSRAFLPARGPGERRERSTDTREEMLPSPCAFILAFLPFLLPNGCSGRTRRGGVTQWVLVNES